MSVCVCVWAAIWPCLPLLTNGGAHIKRNQKKIEQTLSYHLQSVSLLCVSLSRSLFSISPFSHSLFLYFSYNVRLVLYIAQENAKKLASSFWTNSPQKSSLSLPLSLLILLLNFAHNRALDSKKVKQWNKPVLSVFSLVLGHFFISTAVGCFPFL